MAKLIAALAAAAVMIVIILMMVNFFLRMIGGGLISSLSDATIPLETQPVTDSLPWDIANDEELRSDAAFDNAGEVASDSHDDNAIDETADEDEEDEQEEVPLLDPDEVSPGDYAESPDTDQTQWNDDAQEEEGKDQAAAARFAQVLTQPELLSNLPDDVVRRLYQPLTVLDIDETQAFDLWQFPDSPGESPGQVYGSLVGVTVLEKGEISSRVSAVDYLTDRRVQGYVPNELLRTVYPDKRYSIVIDKADQKLYLFAGQRLAQALACSTGAAGAAGAADRVSAANTARAAAADRSGSIETPSGEFITGGVKETIYSEVSSDVAYYGVRFNGRVYIHGIPHVNGDYSEGQADLGKKASHGCVRIAEEEAKWLYENLPAGTRVLVMGDEHTIDQRVNAGMENG